MKIIHWNVNGIRALIRNINFETFVKRHKPTILCFSEIKSKQLPPEVTSQFQFCEVHSGQIAGYSGTAICSNLKPLETKRFFLREGRIIAVTFESVIVVCVYAPNSKPKLERLNYRMRTFEPKLLNIAKCILQQNKPTVFVGDFNVAMDPNLDIYDSKVTNLPGSTEQERSAFGTLMSQTKLEDAFRKLHPNKKKFTYWDYRIKSRSHGWRLDYFLISKQIDAQRCSILDHEVGSDHVPIELNWSKKKP